MWRIDGRDVKERWNKSEKKERKAESRCKRVAVVNNHNLTQPDALVTADNAPFAPFSQTTKAADVNADFTSDFRKMKIISIQFITVTQFRL